MHTDPPISASSRPGSDPALEGPVLSTDGPVLPFTFGPPAAQASAHEAGEEGQPLGAEVSIPFPIPLDGSARFRESAPPGSGAKLGAAKLGRVRLGPTGEPAHLESDPPRTADGGVEGAKGAAAS